MSAQKEFGDFQTPMRLAEQAVALVAELSGKPDLVVEPTAGLGSFLRASHARWKSDCKYEGYEINPDYAAATSQDFAQHGIKIHQQDFFAADWERVLQRENARNVLVLGNPPWVTNSALGSLGSDNLPQKKNSQGLRGLDAKTGKSNFDIAEFMLVRLIEALPETGAIAMLCKTMTARKVLRHFWKKGAGLDSAKLFHIEAKRHFGVMVDACFFYALRKPAKELIATKYSQLSIDSGVSRFGFVDGNLASDVEAFNRCRELDGGSSYAWRSGVKHDASQIMEFMRKGEHLFNGIQEPVAIEEEYLYPLLKSSDIGNARTTPRKLVLIPQRKVGDATEAIKHAAPSTWAYLEKHSSKLDSRKSSIYQNRPRFSIFGIGEYSFALWKVAISGLYKSIRFVVVPPVNNRPVMLDDTCYLIPCSTQREAQLLCDLLNSQPAQDFLGSLIFSDSKRPVTIEVLSRVSLVNLSRRLGRFEELKEVMASSGFSTGSKNRQLKLVM